jgi:hypothetical protein
MNDEEAAIPVRIARANEMLRQERDTFDQQKEQAKAWFRLRLVMGYSSVVLLGVITVVSAFILLNNRQFPSWVVTSAGGALFVDVLGLLAGVYKIVLAPDVVAQLSPVTRIRLPGDVDEKP